MATSTEGWLSPTLSDGLGNRLFQLAAATTAAEKYKKQLVLFLPRCYKASHSPSDQIPKLFPQIPIVETDSSQWHEIPEKSFATYEPFPPLPPTATQNIVLRGWRQSALYLPYKGFTPNWESALGASELRRIEGLIQEPACAAFLHVRLGDYRILPHHFVNLEGYWVQCLHSLQEEELVKRVYVFSNETEYTETNLVPFFRTVAPNLEFHIIRETSPVAALYAMSLVCGGAICANSTFSWWGAYFSAARSAGKQIYMPAKWGDFDTKDLYPDWATKIA
jgi:hypothetical protein